MMFVGLLAPAAAAGLDPDTDSIGIYFDADGTTNCISAAPFEVLTAYLLLMNPAGPTNGFACSVDMAGVPHFVLAASPGYGPGCDADAEQPPGTYLYACGADMPVSPGGALRLMTWTLMLAAPGELVFRVGPHPVPLLPGGMPVVVGNGVLRACGISSGDVNLPVASINAGNCPVGEEASSFGRVKSLFR